MFKSIIGDCTDSALVSLAASYVLLTAVDRCCQLYNFIDIDDDLTDYGSDLLLLLLLLLLQRLHAPITVVVV